MLAPKGLAVPGPKGQAAARRAACEVVFVFWPKAKSVARRATCGGVFASSAKRCAGPEGACMPSYFALCAKRKASPEGRHAGRFYPVGLPTPHQPPSRPNLPRSGIGLGYLSPELPRHTWPNRRRPCPLPTLVGAGRRPAKTAAARPKAAVIGPRRGDFAQRQSGAIQTAATQPVSARPRRRSPTRKWGGNDE